MSRARGPAVALATLLTLACAPDGETPPPAPAGDGPGTAAAPLTLTALQVPALETTHVGGSPTVDYIVESIGSGGAWLDHDGDGDPDLYLAQGATVDAPEAGPPDLLLRNDGQRDGVPVLTDVTAEAGLGDTRWSFGVAVADIEGDGDPDIYLTNWGRNRLYRNDGDGTFTDIAEAAGVDHPGWGTSAAWADIDGDGDLDLYVANYVVFSKDRYPPRGTPAALGPSGCIFKSIPVFCGPLNLEPEPDVLYRNDGDLDGDGIPDFRDATAAAGLAGRARFALGVVFGDLDDDGDQDLYVANDSVQNALFWNRGDGTFEEGGLLSGTAFNEEGRAQAGMGVDIADYDGDGRDDIAVTNFSHDHDTLYRNEGDGLFTDMSYRSGIGTPSFMTLGWGLAFADFDHDGHEDIFVTHGHVYPQVDDHDLGTTYRQPNALFRNLGDGTFEDRTGSAGTGLEVAKTSRGLALADMDGDGDVDVLVTNRGETPDLLRNDGAPGHWLGVRLRGRGGNRDGIGARVTVEAGGRSRSRTLRRNYTFQSSSEPVARFGLGEIAAVDRVRVRWPSGKTSTVEKPAIDRVLLVEE